MTDSATPRSHPALPTMEPQRRRLASLASALAPHTSSRNSSSVSATTTTTSCSSSSSSSSSGGHRLKLGILGLGAIGLDLVRLCGPGAVDPALTKVDVVAVLVQRPRSTGERAVLNLASTTLLTADAEEWYAAGPYDAVLEVAGHSAVREHGARVLGTGAELLVTSVGAFADDALLAALTAAAERAATRLNIPSSGIGALDILSAAAVGGLESVRMTVRKDPSAWFGTIAEEQHDLHAIDIKGDPFVLFEGTAREGAALYPQNVNISAAVALAGIGLDRTALVIVADPTIQTHVIEVIASGEFGSFKFEEDVAVSEHRKTGKIVAMAVAKTVRQLVSPVVIGH